MSYILMAIVVNVYDISGSQEINVCITITHQCSSYKLCRVI